MMSFILYQKCQKPFKKNVKLLNSSLQAQLKDPYEKKWKISQKAWIAYEKAWIAYEKARKVYERVSADSKAAWEAWEAATKPLHISPYIKVDSLVKSP